MRKHRSSFLLSLLMVVLCGSIIIGSTLAYFTSEQTTGENIIAASTLKAGLDWAYQLPGSEDGWQNAANGVLFNETSWEPNYSAVRYIRVKNGGSLAFSYELNVLPTMVVEGGPELMDVIDVYYGVVDAQTPAITRSNFAQQLTRMGTMTELLSNEHGAGYGILLPEGVGVENLPAGVEGESGTVTACIVLHMQQQAGNEYMGLSAGEGFKLQLAAVQYNYDDAFANIPNPSLPDVNGYGTEVIKPLESVQGGMLTADMVFTSSNGVTATVPAGAKVDAGVTELKLIVTPKAQSDADVTLQVGEALDAWEVRVEGLAKDNTVPVRISLGAVMQKSLNIGNYDLYHVEGDATNKMTRVDAVDETSAHNSYSYDPATGEVEVAMATFSEVAVVAEEENVWKGVIATSFSGGDGTEENPFVIANADQLAYMNECISTNEATYGDKHYKLIADLNFGGEENWSKNEVIWYPIGYRAKGEGANKAGEPWYTYGGAFSGVFDGQGHTITGIYQNTWAMDGNYDNGYWKAAMGLFGYVNGGTVKNLTIDNFYSEGEFAPTGCVTAYAAGKATFENIAITNSHPQTYNTGVAGIVGWDEGDNSEFTFMNITIDSTNTISALWGSWDVAAAGLLGYLSENSKATLDNCHVSATIDVYNDVCGNYQYYWYRYCGMLIGTVDKTDADGNLDLSNIVATNCTVDFGDRHEYYYCEFVKNSIASYTHDYQFSRVDHKELIIAETPTCTHEHKKNGYEVIDGISVLIEDKQAVYIPFRQLFGGYGWGVKGVDIEQNGSLDIDDISISETEHDYSLEKFIVVDAAVTKVSDGDIVNLNAFFTEQETATSIVPIDLNNVQVFVSPIGEESTVSAVYEANEDDWEVGKLSFSGVGKAQILISDYYYCKTATVDIEVGPKLASEKFAHKFPNTDTYLYRVGNMNTITLGSLFKLADENTEIDSANVAIQIETIDGTAVKATYIQNKADWTKGTIQFANTGIAKVTITDNTQYCLPTELYLEVITASNATSKEDAKDKNIVLLNDIVGGFTVSNGCTFYGNGFKVICAGDGSYRSAAVSYGFVTVENGGILDNVQIICDIFPESYLYTSEMKAGSDGRYPYGYSGVVITGDCTVSNCYIYGARNNIQVGEGNILIENTVLECGSLSNIHIKSNDAYTVILDDVTTIQYKITSKYDTNKTVLGFGVLVGTNESASNPTIQLKGDFKQYNWVTNADSDVVSNSYAKQVITNALTEEVYTHTIEDAKTVNMGIAYLNELTSIVDDQRENRDSVPYVLGTIKMLTYTGQVYSISNCETISTNNRYNPKTDGVIPYCAQKNRPSEFNLAYTEEEGVKCTFGYNSTSKRRAGIIEVDLDVIDGGSFTFNFDELRVEKFGKELLYEIRDNNGNLINKDSGLTLSGLSNNVYELTIIDNLLYGFDGNLLAERCSYFITLSLKSTKTSIDPPKFTNAGTATAIRLVTSKGGEWRPAYTALTGVSVTYWSASEAKVKTIELDTLYNLGTISNNVWTYVCSDYTLTITGGKVHSEGATITPIKANNTLYFASMNKTFTTNTKTRNIILTYVFTDKNDSTTWNRTETVTYSDLEEYDYNSFKDDGTLEEPSDSTNPCVTPDTLITLADGTQKRVDSLTGEEQLLVWNMETGSLDAAPILFVDSEAEGDFEVIHLLFSDGTDVKVIYEHGFWDYDLNKYVYLDRNAEQYIGHWFFELADNGGEKVQLVDVKLEKETTTAWSPVTADHLCYFVNGMLSMPGGVGGLFNIFEVNPDTMTYDQAAMLEDIQKYGLFTYEELNAIVGLPENMFEEAGGAYLKVSIGKGNLTMDELVYMIERYKHYFE